MVSERNICFIMMSKKTLDNTYFHVTSNSDLCNPNFGYVFNCWICYRIRSTGLMVFEALRLKIQVPGGCIRGKSRPLCAVFWPPVAHDIDVDRQVVHFNRTRVGNFFKFSKNYNWSVVYRHLHFPPPSRHWSQVSRNLPSWGWQPYVAACLTLLISMISIIVN